MWWWWRVGLLLLCIALRPVQGIEAAAPSKILIDATSGQVLSEENADAVIRAGTLSQLMVVLLSLEEAGMGALPLDVPVTVSATTPGTPAVKPAAVPVPTKKGAKRVKATPAPPSQQRLSLRSDRAYVLSDLLKAMLLASSNEAAVAVAEAIAGGVPACIELMNERAQRLGMTATHYASIVGDGPGDTETTTVRDLGRLARVLVQHPSVIEWSSLNGLPFDQGETLLRNVNQLVGSVPGVDGLQVSSTTTGHGVSYNIVASAQRGPLRLIAAVAGVPNGTERYKAAADLLEWGFAHYERLEIVRKGDPLNFAIDVRHGSLPDVTPVAGHTFSLLRRRDEEHDLQLRYQLPTVLTAPLRHHQPIGEIIIEEKGQLIAVVPVLNPTAVRTSGILAAALP